MTSSDVAITYHTGGKVPTFLSESRANTTKAAPGGSVSADAGGNG
jgi:hypothetical protein